MSMADTHDGIKGTSLVVLAEQLEASIREAARGGKPLYEVEKDTFARLLAMGHAAVEQLLILQGDGDLGESVVTTEGRQLERSEEPVERPLRTVTPNCGPGLPARHAGRSRQFSELPATITI